MTKCNHPLRQEDSLGQTCLLCGETLGGYGFGGEGQNHCRHTYDIIDDQEICWYCNAIRPYHPQEKKIALAIIQSAHKANSSMLELIETWLVAGLRPDDIADLAWAAGHRNAKQWRLAATYFYDFNNE